MTEREAARVPTGQQSPGRRRQGRPRRRAARLRPACTWLRCAQQPPATRPPVTAAPVQNLPLLLLKTAPFHFLPHKPLHMPAAEVGLSLPARGKRIFLTRLCSGPEAFQLPVAQCLSFRVCVLRLLAAPSRTAPLPAGSDSCHCRGTAVQETCGGTPCDSDMKGSVTLPQGLEYSGEGILLCTTCAAQVWETWTRLAMLACMTLDGLNSELTLRQYTVFSVCVHS